jgi:hypothetical protein
MPPERITDKFSETQWMDDDLLFANWILCDTQTTGRAGSTPIFGQLITIIQRGIFIPFPLSRSVAVINTKAIRFQILNLNANRNRYGTPITKHVNLYWLGLLNRKQIEVNKPDKLWEYFFYQVRYNG